MGLPDTANIKIETPELKKRNKPQLKYSLKNFFISHKNPLAVFLAMLLIEESLPIAGCKPRCFPEITFPKIKIIADAGLQTGGQNDGYGNQAIGKCY